MCNHKCWSTGNAQQRPGICRRACIRRRLSAIPQKRQLGGPSTSGPLVKLRLHRTQRQHNVLLHLWNVTGQRGTRTTTPCTHQRHSFTEPCMTPCSHDRLQQSYVVHAIALMVDAYTHLMSVRDTDAV